MLSFSLAKEGYDSRERLRGEETLNSLNLCGQLFCRSWLSCQQGDEVEGGGARSFFHWTDPSAIGRSCLLSKNTAPWSSSDIFWR